MMSQIRKSWNNDIIRESWQTDVMVKESWNDEVIDKEKLAFATRLLGILLCRKRSRTVDLFDW